jgi:hypothetical protein
MAHGWTGQAKAACPDSNILSLKPDNHQSQVQMKTKFHNILAAAALLSGLSVATVFAQGNSGNNGNNATVPLMPSGWLSAYPTVVQTGTKPTLTWGINYPSIVKDYITIIDPATIKTKEKLDCEIRILGAGVTSGNSSSYVFVPTEAQISDNGGNYTRIFYGTNLNVNPNTVVWSKKNMAKNRTLRFGGRYFFNNNWGTTFTSTTNSHNVRTLVNGDIPPSNIPQWDAPSLEEFLRPYLDPSGRVKIGPMDVIVFMELTHTNQSDPGYDLQDMVLLVTFKSEAHNNNGHGNNIDGVDSSNPGNAPFINLDTDPNFDDEGHGGGAAPSQP